MILLSYDLTSVSSLAPPATRPKSVASSNSEHESGRDYLSLDEEDDEFTEESIALLRSMASNFRSGLAQSLTQGGATADARSGDGGGGGGEGEEGGGGSQVMKYIMQIFKGFQMMRKSISSMFQQIANAGGQRLAQRILSRMSNWIKQGSSQLQNAAKQAQDAVPGAGGDGASQVPNGARVPF